MPYYCGGPTMSAWAVVRTTTALAARQQGRRAAADRGRRVAVEKERGSC
jgi:hypothetical protein